jgi:hypothetical protein
VITLSATLQSGAGLPAFLIFNGVDFYIAPATSDAGTYIITVIIFDGFHIVKYTF